ncbi:hypothetical protein [Verrucomicrobium sp. 3C]|uniref:hypothetical protein n=1 Tax=Verrucomicrobium sp. 3C TaxID=1134055 RepID=UPI0003A01ADC|nr:hypothetical protein [Verrucomicrobium sp. 3C]
MKPSTGTILLILLFLLVSPAMAGARWVAVQRPPILARTSEVIRKQVNGVPVYLAGAPSHYHIFGAVFIDEDELDECLDKLVAKGVEHGAKGLLLFSPSEKRAHAQIYGEGIWAWCYR